MMIIRQNIREKKEWIIWHQIRDKPSIQPEAEIDLSSLAQRPTRTHSLSHVTTDRLRRIRSAASLQTQSNPTRQFNIAPTPRRNAGISFYLNNLPPKSSFIFLSSPLRYLLSNHGIPPPVFPLPGVFCPWIYLSLIFYHTASAVYKRFHFYFTYSVIGTKY